MIAGSLSSYFMIPPSIRIYTMHAKYHVPVDMKVLEFNLEDAN